MVITENMLKNLCLENGYFFPNKVNDSFPFYKIHNLHHSLSSVVQNHVMISIRNKIFIKIENSSFSFSCAYVLKQLLNEEKIKRELGSLDK